MYKGYRYRIYPSKEQIEKLEKAFNCSRFVYNLGLETKIQAWMMRKKRLSFIDLCYQLKELKDTEAKWLKDCPSQCLRMALKNLDNAYIQFFKGKGFPKFRSKRGVQKIQFPQFVKIDFSRRKFIFPILGEIDCIFDRVFTEKIKCATIIKTRTNKYFVSTFIDDGRDIPKKKEIEESTTIGIDLGIKDFAILSDGTKIENQRFLKKNLKRLKIEQRKLQRRFKKGEKIQSKSFEKQRLVVSLLHEKIKNKREDFLQKLSTKIIKDYDSIALENLNIKGMIKNHNLAQSIKDVSWYRFKTMLKYKAEWYGKNILEIGIFDPSSKICSNCGSINKNLTLEQREWTCTSCGKNHDRDTNAAINIKNFGLRVQPSIANANQ